MTTPKRKAAVSRARTVVRLLMTGLVVVALLAALGGMFLYRQLDSNLQVDDLTPELGDDRPVRTGPTGALNILVMGSDSRAGANAIDSEDPNNGARSDTTILLHLSADRTRAYGISIPRDSLVTRPDCGRHDEIPGGGDQMWNAAFAVGGPACTIRQVEATTGVYVDNYVVVDFNGFKGMVDAIDGVPVCVPATLSDPKTGITVKAGRREIRGDEALDYVRIRSAEGTSKSDLGRIKRQQTFIAAMTKKLASSQTITRPDRLVRFLNEATKSLRLDFTSIRDLAGLGLQLQDIGLDNIQFVTVPWEYTPEYRVRWRPEAQELWRLTRLDKPLTVRFAADAVNAQNAPGATSPTSPTTTPPPSTAPAAPSSGASPVAPGTPPTPSPQAQEEARLSGVCA